MRTGIASAIRLFALAALMLALAAGLAALAPSVPTAGQTPCNNGRPWLPSKLSRRNPLPRRPSRISTTPPSPMLTATNSCS